MQKYGTLINMKIEEIILNSFEIEYPLSRIRPLDEILFIDIETTGFLSSSSSIYMIGCAFYKDSNWCIKQFFAQSPDEESSILEAFFDFAKSFNFIIQFNGNTFDLPFIKNKAEKYGLTNIIDGLDGIDIYRRINTYKSFLKIEDCKLKTIEEYLGIQRDDIYNGGELISVYKEYVNSRDFDLYQSLILHNADDMKGMLEVLPVLSYFDLFNTPLTATKVSASTYQDVNGITRKELLIHISFASALPVPISFMGKGCHFKAVGNTGTLIVPIYEEELKFFYANYKDYYYLPIEDTALHKSIATYVDKEFREQAKASNCYTRKISSYLPQWIVLVEPFFKREYDSTDLFFELTDEIKSNRKLFSEYASHILNTIAFQK